MDTKYGLNYLIDVLDISALDLSKHINVHRTLMEKRDKKNRCYFTIFSTIN